MPRRNWNIYNSLIGTFYRGTPKGLVSIRYSDGSVYEGKSFDWPIQIFDSRSSYLPFNSRPSYHLTDPTYI